MPEKMTKGREKTTVLQGSDQKAVFSGFVQEENTGRKAAVCKTKLDVFISGRLCSRKRSVHSAKMS